MSKHLNSRQKPERLVFIVGLTIGLSILGDSFLYGNLPIEAENLGIALPLGWNPIECEPAGKAGFQHVGQLDF